MPGKEMLGHYLAFLSGKRLSFPLLMLQLVEPDAKRVPFLFVEAVGQARNAIPDGQVEEHSF